MKLLIMDTGREDTNMAICDEKVKMKYGQW